MTSDASKYARRLLVLVAFGEFLATVDAPIVSIATPAITHAFAHQGIDKIAWVLDAYFVAFAATLLASGPLADRFGRAIFMCTGLVLLMGASAVCAVTDSLNVLIGARALQAIGGGMVVPAGQALMLGAFRPHERYRAITTIGTVVALGVATAPTIGGLLVQVTSWRWIFWGSTIAGAATVAFALRVVKFDRGDPTACVPDPVGVTAQTAGAALLVFAILRVSHWGLGDVRVWGSALLSLALISISLARSRTHRAPALNLSLFRSPVVAWSNAASFFVGAALFGFAFAAVLYFAEAWHWSTLEIGLSFLPGTAASIIAGGLAPRLAEKYGAGPITLGCIVMGALGTGLIITMVAAKQNFWLGFVPGQIVYCAGLAAGLTALVALAVVSAPGEQFGSAGGINGAARQIGGAIGVAIVAEAFASRSLTPLGQARAGWIMAAVALLIAAAFAVRLTAHQAGAARVAGGAIGP